MDESLKVNEEGLEKVAQRFFSRRDVKEVCSTIEEVKRILIEHAKRGGNKCVNCIYSSPYRGRLSWTSRYCVLGFKRGDCNMHTPIITVKGEEK
jgi:hypothetical protein